MSCCGGGGCGGGGCGSGGGCGGGGCGGGGCGGGGCGSGGGGCGSSGGCANCPRRRQPIAMICFERAALLKVIDALKGQADYEAVCDEKLGLVLRVPGQAEPQVAAERLEFDGPIDPMTGWTVEAARREPLLGLAPPGPEPVARGPASELFGALLVSRGAAPAFFALLPRDSERVLHALRPVPYPRLSADELRAALEGPQQWPPASWRDGARLPQCVVGGFELDPAADACQELRGTPFVATGRAPSAGHGLFVHVALGAGLALPWVRMAGAVERVGELPAEGAAPDAAVGPSFFVECTCGREHPRDEVLRELGAIHGQRLWAHLYLTPEFAGRLPELDGQWDAVLVADDHKQFIWQLESLVPRPRDKWVPRS